MSISGKAKLAGVMGWPVGHSLSPRLHGHWIDELKLDAAYVPLPVSPQDFAQVFALLPKMGFVGVNVTVPHKETAFALVQQRDETAEATGAVNTVIFENGKSIGRNTDVAGFLGMLADAGVTSLAGKTALVLGAGGAARAVVFALAKLNPAQILIFNRTLQKADELARRFAAARVASIAAGDLEAKLGRVDIVVNTTSLGMTGQPSLSIDLAKLPPTATVADIVYKPLETDLLARARARGLTTIDGLGMLMHQAAPAFAAWFGVEPKVTHALRVHLVAAL